MTTHAPEVLALVAALLTGPVHGAKDRAPGFFEQSLDLPGMPAAVLPADIDGDGTNDLVVMVAYTVWGQVAETEAVQFDDIEGLVEVMNVVSSLVDHRELRVYPGRPRASGFAPHLTPMELDTSLHALDKDEQDRILAVTDRGIARVAWTDETGVWQPRLEPILEAESSMVGSGSFYSELRFLHDLDGDGTSDVLLPTPSGWSVYRGDGEGFEPVPRAMLTVPPRPVKLHWSEYSHGEGRRPRSPRLPKIEDVDRDGHPDLVLFAADSDRDPIVWRNRGELTYGPALEISAPGGKVEEIVYIGELERSGEVMVVSAEELEPHEDAGYKLEIEHAKEPDFRYRIYPLSPDLTLAAQPLHEFEAEGYTFEGSDDHDEDVDIRLPGGFQDLDGDGRQDLVAITLDFSLIPMAFKILALRRVSLRMDFHPHCQSVAGDFRTVPNLDLSGKFKLNLRRLQVRHLSQFEGDCNGDGRADFVQLGRGKRVTIHQGGPGCTYPIEPDREIRLAKQPQHLGLVRILDLDANGLSDLYVVHPQKDPKSGETAPVRLDLYLGESG